MQIKQWNLPRGATVRTKEGELLKFLGMDGMYGKWETEEKKFAIGSFDGFVLVGDEYHAI